MYVVLTLHIGILTNFDNWTLVCDFDSGMYVYVYVHACVCLPAHICESVPVHLLNK